MLQCNIQFLILLNRCTDLLHMLCEFFWWTTTKFAKIGVLLLFSMEFWVLLCNFWTILQKSSSTRPLTRNHSYLLWKDTRGPYF